MSHSGLKNILFFVYGLILFTFFFVLSIAIFLEIDFDVRPFFGLSREIHDDEATRSVFYFLQLYLYYFLCYFLCLNYLRGSRLIGYSLNPEIEDSYQPPRVLLLIGTLLIVLLVVNFSTDLLDGPYSMRPYLLHITKALVLTLYFYFVVSGLSVGFLIL